ncbi:hypothetical protein BAU15_08245 [Enterococcus sp. JM4C]|uniref:helix-turn-helix domain-containing protein n=1 Tax=Candidatus Enterococcus huntleyi TaxID=1857217 RepID=UPI00137A92AE|nr:helix-turn-helix transcriptional regulator [Enterococcus sp. JM4C]KAF1297885.1 hypothetical protein BAU15_08245 [Enterococcus sp. JM4C]
MDISNKLKNNRKKSGYTQEQISRKLHVSRQTISNWETGKSVPDIYSLIELSSIYDVSLDYLIKEDVIIMNAVKKEEKEKKMINRGLFLGGIGLICCLISLLITHKAAGGVLIGLGFSLIMLSMVLVVVIKVLHKVYK